MTPELFLEIALEPAMRLLPVEMDTPNARAMVLAICLQESGLRHRLQMGGPARGYAQFERGGGVRGVMTHQSTKQFARVLCAAQDVPWDQYTVHEAIAYNDIVNCGFARLLLWSSPLAIPGRADAQAGWTLYLSTWRPSKPHPDKWDGNFAQAWSVIA